MSEEIKQKAREELRELFPLEYLRNEIDNFGYASLENWIDDLLSQALQKRGETFLEILEDNRKETMWAEKSDQEVSDQGITDFIDAVKIKLSTLTTK